MLLLLYEMKKPSSQFFAASISLRGTNVVLHWAGYLASQVFCQVVFLRDGMNSFLETFSDIREGHWGCRPVTINYSCNWLARSQDAPWAIVDAGSRIFCSHFQARRPPEQVIYLRSLKNTLDCIDQDIENLEKILNIEGLRLLNQESKLSHQIEGGCGECTECAETPSSPPLDWQVILDDDRRQGERTQDNSQ